MTTKHMKRYLMSLIIREMKFKTIRYHQATVRISKIKKTIVDKDTKKLEYSFIADGCIQECIQLAKVLHSF